MCLNAFVLQLSALVSDPFGEGDALTLPKQNQLLRRPSIGSIVSFGNALRL